MKKSKVISPARFIRLVYRFFCNVANDLVTVYAAQATFFIIISSIPFLLLLLSLTKYFIDANWVLSLIDEHIVGDAGKLVTGIVREILEKGGIPLVSVTVLSTLWSSSRGVNAVMRGVSGAYGIKHKENFLWDIGRSLIYTLAFIVLIIAVLVAVIFSESIVRAASVKIPLLATIFQIIDDSSTVVFIVLLTMFFTLLYNTVSKKGKRISKNEYEVTRTNIPTGPLAQLPGAIFAAVGWVLFSKAYKLYIIYFPNASYVYGSLAAVVFMILWLYFCMIILLYGAEINKSVFLMSRKIQRTRELENTDNKKD